MNLGGVLIISACACLSVTDGKASPLPEPGKTKSVQAGSVPDVEKIARLQRSLESAQKELAALQKELKDPTNDYHKTLIEFQKLDEAVKTQEKELKTLTNSKKLKEANLLKLKHKDLQKQWRLAKEALALTIQEQKTKQQKAKVLADKIQQEQKVLDRLTGKEPPSVAAVGAGNKKDGANQKSAPDTTAAGHTTKSSPASIPPANLIPSPVKLPTENPENAKPPAKDKTVKESKELKQAKKEAQAKEVEAKQAKEKAKSIGEQLETLKKNIQLDRVLLQTARKKLDNSQKKLSGLERDQQQKLEKDANPDELRQGWKKINEERKRYEKTRLEVRAITNNLTQLQEELTALQQEKLAALQEADHKTRVANTAKQKVAELQNPFAPQNLLKWSFDKGPQVLGILFCMVLLHVLVRLVSRRIVGFVAKHSKRKRERESAQRAETLVGVFRSFSTIAIGGGGTLMLLETLDIPIVPLMGGAAVLGLAVAFGAQNLIRDYFTGFMILVEDQYAVRDYVRIGDIEGTVERITMRMTVLRDRNGSTHFMPHGNITNVTNQTHSWSRAFFDIGVAYKENVDRVMAVIKETGAQLREDPTFGAMITDDLEMMGVDNFADSAVMIRFYIRTKPLTQWKVKREMLRRLKNRFDELDIEIPFPHRTVYHRDANDAGRQESESKSKSGQAA